MTYVIWDTETTALIKNSAMPLSSQPHIIELYACLCDENGNILEDLGFRCNPGIMISQEITDITKITDADLKNLPGFDHYALKVKEIFEKADVMVAQNLSYDWAVTGFEFQRLKLDVKFPEIKVCTVEATEYIKGFRLNLTALHEYCFGVPFENAHSAKGDVKALKDCFFELKKKGVV